ncbi:MAG TPA: hypothetical protein VF795_00795 [Desulfuromonadaceae bacterium]
MAEKGARARLEPVGKMLYCDGKSKVAIAEILEVSRQTVDDWCEWGGWDKAKSAKDNYEAQLLQARDTIMEQITAAPLQAASYLDSLAKIEAILDRRARTAREAAEAISRQRGEMFLQFVKDLIDYGGKHAPELTTAIQGNFDDIIQWGRERYAA